MAAAAEAPRMPILAAASNCGSVKASPPTKMAMVKPMPASKPTSSTPGQVTPWGIWHRPVLTAKNVARNTPTGLPSSSASMMPEATVAGPTALKSTPPNCTPAFANAKTGMTAKATQGCSIIGSRKTGGSRSRWARVAICSSSYSTCASKLPLRACTCTRERACCAASKWWRGAGRITTGVISPSTTPASVGCAPVCSRPNHSTAPGKTYSHAEATPMRLNSSTSSRPTKAIPKPL